MNDDDYLKYALRGVDLHRKHSIENAGKTDLYDMDYVMSYQAWFDDLKEAIHLKPPTGYFNELIVIQRQDSLTIREVSYRYIQSAEPDGLFYIAIQEEEQV